MHQSDRGIRDSLLHQSDRDNTSYTEYVSSFYFFPAPASFLARTFLVFVKIVYMIGIFICYYPTAPSHKPRAIKKNHSSVTITVCSACYFEL